MRINKALIVIFLIPLLIIFSWYKDGGIHGQGEEGLPFYNVEISARNYSSLWREISGGYSNTIEISRGTLFQILKIPMFLGFPDFAIQALLDYLLMVIGLLSVYFLVKITLSDQIKDNRLPLFAAIFYLLNPFSLSQIWGRGLYMQFFPFALHPLFLFLYILALKRKSILPLILALLSSFILASAFQHVAYFINLWFLIIAYSVFYLYFNRTKKDLFLVFGYFSFLFIGFILTQGWWLNLYFGSTANAYSSNITVQVRENLGTLLGVSSDFSLPTIIRLLHEGYFFRDAKYGEIYKSVFFQGISGLIPLIAVFSLKYFRKSRNLIFFAAIFLIGLLFSLGANFPLGFLFKWLFINMPPMQIFRNPYEKFGLIFIIGYSVIFAAGLLFITNKIKGIWIIIVFLLFGVYAWPIWSGRVISGVDKKVGIQVPSYYHDLNKWLKDQKATDSSYRLMMLPLASGEGVVYQWENRLYNGIPPSDYLLDYPSVSSNPRVPYFFDYMQGLRKYLGQVNSAPAISLLGAKYIVDRQDMIQITPGEKLHKNYLLDTVYAPQQISNLKRQICSKGIGIEKVENFVWLSCILQNGEFDWSDVKYMHLRVGTDKPSILEIAVTDGLGYRPVWNGQIDPEYSTGADGFDDVVVVLNTPTEFLLQTNFSDIRRIEIKARPKNPNSEVSNINLQGVWLDSGQAHKIDEYKFVKSFGPLNLYENMNFNAPPHLGILSNIKTVKSFRELIGEAFNKRDQINKVGFLLEEQNKNKDFEKLLSASKAAIVESKVFSNTKYFVETDPKMPIKLYLGERFDPSWKVIPDVEENDLNGSFFSNLKLLRKAYLSESEHFVVNGYANLWYINEGVQNYAVVFLPQITRDAGYTAALGVTVILLITAIALISKKKIKINR